MKITREQYETAKRNTVRLQHAQAIVNAWDDALVLIGRSIEGLELTEIEIDGDGPPSFKGKPKEKSSVKDAAA